MIKRPKYIRRLQTMYNNIVCLPFRLSDAMCDQYIDAVVTEYYRSKTNVTLIVAECTNFDYAAFQDACIQSYADWIRMRKIRDEKWPNMLYIADNKEIDSIVKKMVDTGWQR